jgi:hypothetical protein
LISSNPDERDKYLDGVCLERHSRAGGDIQLHVGLLDSRLRGNDEKVAKVAAFHT